MKQSNMSAIRKRQEAESAMQESPRPVSEGPITTSRAKLATSGKEKSVMKVSQKVLVPMKRFNPKSTPVTQFNPIGEELLQSFQQFTNPTEQVRDVRNNMNPKEKIKDARINGNPTEQIRDVSKNMNPTERIRDVSKNVRPTSQIRHARINVNPTERIRGVRKNVNPTEQVSDVSKNMNPTERIMDVGKNVSPTSQIRHARINVNLTEQIRGVRKNVNPTEQVRESCINVNPTEQIRESRINVNPTEQIRDVGENVNPTEQVKDVRKNIKDGREHANPTGHTNHKRENANTGQSFVKMGSFMKTDQKKSFVKIGAFMKLTTHTKGKLGAHAIPSFPENTIRPRHPFTNTKFCAHDSSAEEYRTDCNGDLISAMDEIEDDSLSDSSESVTGSNGNDVSEDEANSRVDNKNEMFNISQQMDRMVKDKVENIMNGQLNNTAMPKLKVVSTKIDKKNTSDESVEKINCDDKIKEILVEGFINEARYCLSKKNYEGAIQNARKGLQKSSRGVEAVELVQILTQGLVMTGKLKESLKVIDALTRFIVKAADNCGTVSEKLRSDTFYLKATILLKLENIDEAINILETLVDEQPYYTKAKNKLDKLEQIANNN